MTLILTVVSLCCVVFRDYCISFELLTYLLSSVFTLEYLRFASDEFVVLFFSVKLVVLDLNFFYETKINELLNFNFGNIVGKVIYRH